MVSNGKTSKRSSVSADVPKVSENLNQMSVEELKRRADSLLENIGALRFSAARIELLDGYRNLLRDLLADARVHVDANGAKELAGKIDRALKETESAMDLG